MVATPNIFLNPFSFSVRLPIAIPVATTILQLDLVTLSQPKALLLNFQHHFSAL